jgi:DNA topoisomerase I
MDSNRRRASEELSCSPVVSARRVGLRYVNGTGVGIGRRRVGKGFVYIGCTGRPIRGRASLARIRSLGIPPAWTNVWICPTPNGHLQAVGRDVKGRKQYLYHPKYREFRDRTKFNRMSAFGKALPKIRKTVAKDLSLTGLPKRKVLATVVRLLETTCMRIGNDQYAKENQSFGLTTLRGEHVEIHGPHVEFKFKGKSGQFQDIQLNDERLARIVKKMQDLPGYDLFEYIGDDGKVARVSSGDINSYLREITGDNFTAKDFRTWYGSVLAISALEEIGPAGTATALKKNIVAAVKATAARLGNRPSASRKYYIHPHIFECYSDGTLLRELNNTNRVASPVALNREEQVFLRLINPTER